jgi:hypothetical protein
MRKRSVVAVVVFVVLLAVIALVRNARKQWPAETVRRTLAPPDLASPGSVNSNVPATGFPDVPAANLPRKDKENLGKIAAAFNAPISFFGKVVDQTGTPIEAAKIYYSAADQYFGKSSKYEGISDSQGLFFIDGIKGAGVYVEVSKPGYERIPNKSYASFGYGVPSGNQPPSRADPAIFVLRKKGAAEPLVVVSSRQFELQKNGTPLGVNLKNGRKTVPGEQGIAVESWIDDDMQDERHRFEWRCRISVPGGGLVERPDNLSFEAPETGYRAFDETYMSQSNPKWKRAVQKDYFVKLQEGAYAHVRLELITGGKHNFCVLESFLNPSGSRNLEFDPAKQIEVP